MKRKSLKSPLLSDRPLTRSLDLGGLTKLPKAELLRKRGKKLLKRKPAPLTTPLLD